MVASNLIEPMCLLSASPNSSPGIETSVLAYRSGSGTSGGSMAGGAHSVNVWCSRSIDSVHVVGDQEH